MKSGKARIAEETIFSHGEGVKFGNLFTALQFTKIRINIHTAKLQGWV